jgi:hypothetical protein
MMGGQCLVQGNPQGQNELYSAALEHIVTALVLGSQVHRGAHVDSFGDPQALSNQQGAEHNL